MGRGCDILGTVMVTVGTMNTGMGLRRDMSHIEDGCLEGVCVVCGYGCNE